MKILSTESFSRITPLLRENYGNIHARLALKLPEQTARMFSRFTLQPSKGGAQWSVNLDCENNLRPFTEADPLQRDQISMVLKQAQADIRKAYGAQADMMEKLLNVPGEESIFFAPTRPGRLPVVVLAAWGFRRVQAAAGESILKLCLERASALSDTPVEIYVGYTDGTPAAGKDFTLSIFGNQIPFTTDENGIFAAGHVMVGKEFEVRSADGMVSAPFTVQSGRSRYDVMLRKSTSLTVRVVKADGETPVAGQSITVDGQTLLTDEAGEAKFGPYTFEGPRNIEILPEGLSPVTHTLQEDAEKNLVVITLAPEIVEEEPEEVPEAIPPHVVIRVLDKKGTPLAGMPVKIFCRRGFEEQTSDAAGCVYIKQSDLVPGETPKVQVLLPPKSSKKLNTPAPEPKAAPVQTPPVPPTPSAPVPPKPNEKQ